MELSRVDCGTPMHTWTVTESIQGISITRRIAMLELTDKETYEQNLKNAKKHYKLLMLNYLELEDMFEMDLQQEEIEMVICDILMLEELLGINHFIN